MLIDRVNEMKTRWCENIRATNPCGEHRSAPYGSCLLGSLNLTKFVVDPFTRCAFDFEEFRAVVKVFTRMLDNVVEINGLPLGSQRDEIIASVVTAWAFRLGLVHHHAVHEVWSKKSVALTQNVSREMALAGWEAVSNSLR